MWRSACTAKPLPPPKPQLDEEDWDTDPDFNNVSEKESRWGAKTIQGSGHQDSMRLDQLREEVLKGDALVKCAETFQYAGKVAPHASQKDYSKGFGGAFGVEKDSQDKSAVGWDHHEKVAQHESQKDYARGFGGKHGVQTDRVDKSAMGWDYHEKLEQHESQKDYAVGFGGKHGIQTDRVDKSAVGWDHRENVPLHESQKDHSKGFGGKYGIQSDRKDKSASGWDEHAQLQQHESQTDYKQGFGGKFGVQSDRKDKSALGWEHQEKVEQHESQTDYKQGFGGKFGLQADRVDKSAAGWDHKENLQQHESQKATDIQTEKGHASSLRSKFEQLAMQSQDGKINEEREKRRREDEELRQKQGEEKLRQQKIEADWEDRENEAGVEEGTITEKRIVNSPTRTRPSIGVRLPFATADAPPKPVRTSEQPNFESDSHQNQDKQLAVTEEKTSQSIPVLPNVEARPNPAIDSLSSLIRRRQSSTDNEQEDEWEQTDQPSSNNKLVLQQPPIGHALSVVDNKNIIHDSEPMNVPPQNQPQYDYVPEEPSIQPTTQCIPSTAAFTQQHYEEPPTEIDVGWWRGMCKGRYGLFPANYVQLRE
ncbi:repeat in HS1/Cortactin domain-containing protein [Ditylenchus destructor]|nr:repeat in HS1/Cortactin domain-containing protein [Ditylenchus destructor]